MYLRIFLTEKGYSVGINNLLPAMHPLLPSSSACLWLQVGVFNRARLSFQWGEGTGQDFQHVQVIQTVATTTRYVYIYIYYICIYYIHTCCSTHVSRTHHIEVYCFFCTASGRIDPSPIFGQVEICHVLLLWNSRSRSRGALRPSRWDFLRLSAVGKKMSI
jgi:hypothetical protein